jgi:hypothetical protein
MFITTVYVIRAELYLQKTKSVVYGTANFTTTVSSLAAQFAFSLACMKACKTTISLNPACPIFRITSLVKPLM